MASTRAQIEAQITVPAGGWSFEATDDLGGPTTVTLPAGTYYHSSAGSNANTLQEALDTATNAVMGRTWNWQFNSGDVSYAGTYYLTATGSSHVVTWTDNELRDLLGFDADLTGGDPYYYDRRAQGFWRSEYGWQSMCGIAGFDGFPETDKHDAENAAGYLYSVTGQTKYISDLWFPMEPQENVIRAAETSASNHYSFQHFIEDTIHAGKAPFSSGGPIRVYPDYSDVSTYVTYYVPGFQDWTPDRLREDKMWDQYWRVGFPRLVKVPG